jgi:hypothetical protein
MIKWQLIGYNSALPYKPKFIGALSPSDGERVRERDKLRRAHHNNALQALDCNDICCDTKFI